MMRVFVIAVTATLLIFGYAVAEIYKYRDASGKVVYSNTPPPAGQSLLPMSSQGSYSKSDTVLPIRERQPSTNTATVKPETRREEFTPQKEPSRAVGTRELSLIRPGMSQTEVRERLGPPADVIDLGYRTFTHYRGYGHGKVSRTVYIEKWVYPGSFSYPPAGIVFQNGRVKSRGRER